MVYGCQIWNNPIGKEQTSKSHTDALEKVQSQALRSILGAYKPSPTAVLRQEAGIAPIALHATKLTLDYINESNDSQAIKGIKKRCGEVAKLAARAGPRKRGKRPGTTATTAYLSRRETLIRATQREGELHDIYEDERKRWTHKRWMEEWREAQAKRMGERDTNPRRRRELVPTAWKWTPHTCWPNPSSEHNYHTAENRPHLSPAISAQEKGSRDRWPAMRVRRGTTRRQTHAADVPQMADREDGASQQGRNNQPGHHPQHQTGHEGGGQLDNQIWHAGTIQAGARNGN